MVKANPEDDKLFASSSLVCPDCCPTPTPLPRGRCAKPLLVATHSWVLENRELREHKCHQIGRCKLHHLYHLFHVMLSLINFEANSVALTE